jgi:hypothetical protein
MFWNKFPYTNFHDLNLDWILSKVKENAQRIIDIVKGDIVVGKATADGEGNNIVDTYETKTNANVTYDSLQTQINENKSDIQTNATNIANNSNNIKKIVDGDTVVGKASADGNGNNIVSTYETKTDATNKQSGLQNQITNITNGTTVVGKASADASGNVITTTYETKTDATSKQSALQTQITNIINGTTTVEEAVHASVAAYADEAGQADEATKATQDGNGAVISTTYETVTHANSQYQAINTRIDNLPSAGGTSERFDMSNVFVIADDILNFSYPSANSNWYTTLQTTFGGTWDYRVYPGNSIAGTENNIYGNVVSLIASISEETRNAVKTVIFAAGMNDLNSYDISAGIDSTVAALKQCFPNAALCFFPSISWKSVIDGVHTMISELEKRNVAVSGLAYTWLGLYPDSVATTSETAHLSASGNALVAGMIYQFIKYGNDNLNAHYSFSGTASGVTGNQTLDMWLNEGTITLKFKASTTGGGQGSGGGQIMPSTFYVDDEINFVLLTPGSDGPTYYLTAFRIYGNHYFYVEPIMKWSATSTTSPSAVTGQYSSPVDVDICVSFAYPTSSS